MSSHIHEYFSNIFEFVQGHMQPVISRIHPRVLNNDNMSLTRPFSKEELQEAIFSMHPAKSPGPDGLSHGFYQKNWGDLMKLFLIIKVRPLMENFFMDPTLNIRKLQRLIHVFSHRFWRRIRVSSRRLKWRVHVLGRRLERLI